MHVEGGVGGLKKIHFRSYLLDDGETGSDKSLIILYQRNVLPCGCMYGLKEPLRL